MITQKGCLALITEIGQLGWHRNCPGSLLEMRSDIESCSAKTWGSASGWKVHTTCCGVGKPANTSLFKAGTSLSPSSIRKCYFSLPGPSGLSFGCSEWAAQYYHWPRFQYWARSKLNIGISSTNMGPNIQRQRCRDLGRRLADRDDFQSTCGQRWWWIQFWASWT